MLKSHDEICKIIEPIYCINQALLNQASKLLDLKLPANIKTFGDYQNIKINPAKISKKAGRFSFESFSTALDLVDSKKAGSVLTLPINKLAWQKAGLNYKGHTDYLSKRYQKNLTMALGCKELFVGLFTDHLPLKNVPKALNTKDLMRFFTTLSQNFKEPIAVLGLNPHAGENGVLGNEEKIIKKAIKNVQKKGVNNLYGVFAPDSAFSPNMRKKFKIYACMYHDQGLTPLKSLYFDQSINVSLGLDFKRSSVDHGTAFDIAYKNKNPNTKSYINAAKWFS